MSKVLKVLLSCEESQAVTKEFRRLGHEAYSCDLQECSGGHPEWHIQGDVTPHLYKSKLNCSDRKDYLDSYDLVLSFHPCTNLTVSGARWFDKKRLSGEQEQSIEFFFNCWFYSHGSENPIGIMNGGEYIKKWFPKIYKTLVYNKFPFKPTQTIQPWQFGHGETKATCLWLNGLPKLTPTDIVEGREQRIWKLPPSKDRGILRSKTYPGIAKAMAEQWSEFMLSGMTVDEWENKNNPQMKLYL